MTTTLTIEEQVRHLSTMTTKSDGGKHFYERYSDDVLDQLEELGLIQITRPVHEATGIPWSQEYHSVEVTPEGAALVQDNPEYWDTDNA